MSLVVNHASRCFFGLCIAILALAQAEAAPPLAPELPAPAIDRGERKRAAAEGKLPLAGTPDLTRLDERLAVKHVTKDASITIRIFKAESELEVWMTTNKGTHDLFAVYPICFWSGALGPKLKEGDRQAPEGFYTISLPHTYRDGARWPVSLDLGFPNTLDKLNARDGSAILIHGGCASIGCFAMTNPVNIELNKLVMRSIDGGQAYVQIHVFPFRMTAENIDRYDLPEWRDFWRNLKVGYDLFERTRRPPRISVCDNSYEFAAASRLEGVNPGPIAVCPRTASLLRELEDINSRVAEQNGPLRAATKPAIAFAFLQLVRPAVPVMSKPRSSSYRQPASGATLTRALPCSLTLPSCRKYSALRERLAQKAAVTAEERVATHRPSTHKKKQRRTASR